VAVGLSLGFLLFIAVAMALLLIKRRGNVPSSAPASAEGGELTELEPFEATGAETSLDAGEYLNPISASTDGEAAWDLFTATPDEGK
jgi:hypothetical protein